MAQRATPSERAGVVVHSYQLQHTQLRRLYGGSVGVCPEHVAKAWSRPGTYAMMPVALGEHACLLCWVSHFLAQT